MDLYVILLRIVHIFSGVFWVGAVAFMVFFIQPTAVALGPDAQKFMQHLIFRRRLTDVVLTTAFLNVIAGILLYWEASAGLRLDWITTGAGIGFTGGALAAFAALGVGFFVTRPAVLRMGALGAEIQAAGQPPTSEQEAELHEIQDRSAKAGRWTLTLVGIALLFMATARYLSF
ncbi:MAG: hypothetical protein ACE5NC_06855 [Anaerolineae bacterium]